LELKGLCTDPEDRAGERYEITLLGGSSDTGILGQKIKDLHRKSKDRFHEYRQYRGSNYPVYEDPPELGLVEKVRGESKWIAWASVHQQMITDALILLSGNRPVYASVNEKKFERKGGFALSVFRVSIQRLSSDHRTPDTIGYRFF
jgi:hypothetical protein